MVGWSDPEDGSRLVISPRDFLRDRGFDGSMKIDLIIDFAGRIADAGA